MLDKTNRVKFNFTFKSRSNKFKVQTKKISDHGLVKICMDELCKQEGFENIENMVQRDLLFLCNSIQSKTGVLISLSTIKRLLHGRFSSLPQIATLDAIAISSGYQSWQNFRRLKDGEIISLETAVPGTGARNKFSSARLFFLGGLLILGAIGLLSIMKGSKSGSGNFNKAQFSATKVTGNSIPNTVVFKYNIDSVIADSFFIQQSWDKNRRVRIFKNNYTLTDIYYEPGYHTAKLIANDKIIKKLDVSIPTDRWFFYAKEKVPKSQPKYIFDTGAAIGGSLKLTRNDVLNSKVDIQKDNEFLQVYFPSVIKSSSDNFVLNFRIKVDELNTALCPYFMSEVFCQKYFMYFISTLKGCTSQMDACYGEHYLSGKTNDFSALATNVKTWQNVQVMVKNRIVTITINGLNAFSTVYHKSCGLITGLGFISNGLCEVEFVDLKTIEGKNIYRSDFTSSPGTPR